jgi:hypothetical protein
MLHGAVVSGKTIRARPRLQIMTFLQPGHRVFRLGVGIFHSKREPLEWNSFILSDKLFPTDCHFCEINGARLLSDKYAREI